IFIGAFLLSALFSFFWVETFFARNLADIRPLFRWMPLLLIFLVSALTMRQWSEEEKMGTQEVLLTLPVKLSSLVLGKFLAVLALVAVALFLTGGLPLSVACLGNLDWGPVVGGYVGALLMASAYIAIGLFISSRTDNQIVALILSVLLSGLFFLVGSENITDFAGSDLGELLRALGTGSRFASIERGVIDLRDVAYYLSLAAFFLVLNVVSLDRKRWSEGRRTAPYRRNVLLGVGLVGLNLLAANLWLNHSHGLRLDLTADRQYSISPVSRDLISGLDEPLLIRGYFSEKTHPLLAPLIPRIRDLMEEYRVASGGRIEVSFVDPKLDEELETEANQLYGIKPVPFQVAGRYEASVVNSYFHILIKYGDQFVTLSFNDLIEVQQRKDGQLDVGLRNLEYDLTKSIKKVVYGFQSLDAVFAKSAHPMQLVAVMSQEAALPKPFVGLPAVIRSVAAELGQESGGKVEFVEIDPDGSSDRGRQAVKERYGVEPLSLSLGAEDSFYLHLLLVAGDKQERIYLRGDLTPADLRREVEAALKRQGAGFMKTVALWTPGGVGGQRGPDPYQACRQALAESYNLVDVDLVDGHVAGDVDVLLLLAPQAFTDRQRFAVDQFLMRGGAVVALAGGFTLDLGPNVQTLQVKEVSGGIGELLAHYGVAVDGTMVMDSRNEPFPVPVSRDLGGFVVQEIRQMAYPFFVDVRSDSMDTNSPVVANLPAVTMNWVSPLTVDRAKNSGRQVQVLLRSSAQSWLYKSTDIQPDFTRFPTYGFAEGDRRASHPLAVAVQGTFASFFAGKQDPRLVKEEQPHQDGSPEGAGPSAGEEVPASVLPRSPDS
ncbi:MAG: Gldg family protein, partial [Desulfobulbaceae bacterium]|nr:Gldg family protein [Desulfobulbaceae bacterium]